MATAAADQIITASSLDAVITSASDDHIAVARPYQMVAAPASDKIGRGVLAHRAATFRRT